jgi:putative nucleotidyltransferase with HDIG domain
MQKDKIVIFSHSDKICAKLSLLLKNRSHCTIAKNLEEVFSLIQQDIQLVILDLEGHIRDPIRLVKRVLSKNSELAILTLLGSHQIGKMAEIMVEGVLDFIINPLDEVDLLTRVEILLERRKRSIQEKAYRTALETRVSMRTEEVWTSYDKIRTQFLSIVRALGYALQARHIYTEGHSRRVAEQVVKMARALGLSREEVQNLELASLFHDIGKIGVRDEVLNKPGPLSASEYEHIKSHPLIAAEILSPIKEFLPIIDIIKHEHEWYDGSGYPNGLKGEEIPLGSRIISIVDCWDSMVYDRIYRKAFSEEEAIRELEQYAGIQFDPTLVRLFMELHRGTPISSSKAGK